MMVVIRVALILLQLALVTGADAAPPGMGDIPGAGPHSGPPAFLMQLFSPRVVMEHQQEIALRPAQADAIKQAMKETQQQLLDLQWRLDAESEALAKVLASDHVDESTVIKKLDVVTDIERQVKKANFTLLVRVKNQLDPEQQVKLRALAPAREFGPGGRLPPPAP